MDASDYLLDCDQLSPMELRKKYPFEANSHRAMLQRRKKGAKVAEVFLAFKGFLRHVGPRPEPGYTIDRLDNSDPEYAPGKVAWRSKLEQTRNRSNSVYLVDSDGTRRTIAEWAAITGHSRHTLYSRRRRGMSDVAVIHGAEAVAAPAINASSSVWPKGHEAQWEAGYRRSAWSRPTGGRELRAEFLLRICRHHVAELMQAASEVIPPGVEPGPEHDQLFAKLDVWLRHQHRAAALLAQPGYLDLGTGTYQFRLPAEDGYERDD